MTETPTPAPVPVKKPWESIGLWGGAISMVASIGALTGVLSAEQVDIINSDAPQIIVCMIGLFGGVMSFYGRIKASSKIKL